MEIYDRLDKILPRLSENQFRENKGLGNEIGFYIFDYNPSYELLVRENIDEFIRYYTPQVKAYCRFWTEISKQNVSKAVLFFTQTKKSVSIDI